MISISTLSDFQRDITFLFKLGGGICVSAWTGFAAQAAGPNICSWSRVVIAHHPAINGQYFMWIISVAEWMLGLATSCRTEAIVMNQHIASEVTLSVRVV